MSGGCFFRVLFVYNWGTGRSERRKQRCVLCGLTLPLEESQSNDSGPT